MPFTFDEQPPEGTDDELKAWLARLTQQLQIADHEFLTVGGGINNQQNLFMRWAGPWIENTYYRVGDVVQEDGYSMICIKDTFDHAAPQQAGAASWGLPTNPAWTQQEATAIVGGGHIWKFNQTGWVKSIRIWVEDVSEGTEYRIIIKNLSNTDFPLIVVVEEQNLDIGEWSIMTSFSSINKLVFPDNEFKGVLFAANTAAETIFIHPWTAEGNGNAAPSAESWIRTGSSDRLRIDNFDDNGVDRSSDMLDSVIGTSINLVNATNPAEFDSYVVIDNPTDGGGYVEWDNIALLQRNGNVSQSNDLCNIEFRIPVAVPTRYVEFLNHWPGGNPPWADINGELSIAGIDQPGKEDSAFGADLLFQPATVSPDWEFVSFP